MILKLPIQELSESSDICSCPNSSFCPLSLHEWGLREAEKKVLLLMAGPLRPYPPPLDLIDPS